MGRKVFSSIMNSRRYGCASRWLAVEGCSSQVLDSWSRRWRSLDTLPTIEVWSKREKGKGINEAIAVRAGWLFRYPSLLILVHHPERAETWPVLYANFVLYLKVTSLTGRGRVPAECSRARRSMREKPTQVSTFMPTVYMYSSQRLRESLRFVSNLH